MNAFLTALLAVNLAFAGADTPLREKGRKAVVGPPLRVGSYAALRGGVTSAAGVELNTQIAGQGRLALDLGVHTRVEDIWRGRELNPKKGGFTGFGYLTFRLQNSKSEF